MSTGIQWTDTVWNPTTGCTRVSAGCDNCYAFQVHDQRHVAWKRGRWDAAPEQYHKPFSQVQLLPDRLTLPLHWRKPRRVFVDSMSDLFHEDVTYEYIDQVFAVMALTPQHTYQVLTKRPERMRAYLTGLKTLYEIDSVSMEILAAGKSGTVELPRKDWPLPNIWLGTSVEDQAAADERIPELLATPAAVRFLSCEPLLGPVDLSEYQPFLVRSDKPAFERVLGVVGGYISWVIVGGESGARARPCDVGWIRSIVSQCQAADVPVFVKQWGARPYLEYEGWQDYRWPATTAFTYSNEEHRTYVRLKHGHGGDSEEWPEDLRVREFPEVRG